MMRQALREAEAALETGDVPVGAVIVHDGQIVGRGRNQRELLQDPTAHAEMIAITAAAEAVGSWRLISCTLYVTLEPCTMCAGAIVNGRIDRVVFGATDTKAGACGSVYNCCRGCPTQSLRSAYIRRSGRRLRRPASRVFRSSAGHGKEIAESGFHNLQADDWAATLWPATRLLKHLPGNPLIAWYNTTSTCRGGDLCSCRNLSFV